MKAREVMLQGNDKVLGLVFSDFRRSIKYPDVTAMFCLRSLETIRREYFDDNSINHDNKRDKNGWTTMSEALNVTRSSVYEEMRALAEKNRHGIYPTITYNQREGMMNFTRDAISKFINWRLNKK